MARAKNLTAAVIGFICLAVSPAWAGINQWTTKGPPGGTYLDFEASTTDSGVFYAAYGRSFHRSADGGNTWQSRDFKGQVQSIAVDPANGDRILVAVIEEGLFRSTDGGRHFTQIAPSSPRIWAAAFGPNNVVYYASEVAFRRSNDGGDSFSPGVPVQQTVEHILVDRS
ncbi:MAG: WD40/YVTN/BNR-like repeat-containing protein, partial [Povalibacter sp.]